MTDCTAQNEHYLLSIGFDQKSQTLIERYLDAPRK
jgi:hypothetical protein